MSEADVAVLKQVLHAPVSEQLLCLTRTEVPLTLVDLNMTWWSLPDLAGTEEEYLMRHGISDEHDLAKHMELFSHWKKIKFTFSFNGAFQGSITMKCVGTGDPPGSHHDFRAYTNVPESRLSRHQSDIEHFNTDNVKGEHWELADVVGPAEHRALLMDEPDENEFAWELQQLAHLAFASVDLILHVESVYPEYKFVSELDQGQLLFRARSH